MSGLWDETQASNFEGPLGERIYSSRLLGSDTTLVLHGGGNTSVKLQEQDLFGHSMDLLYVKCSGYDLAQIDTDGFTGLRLEHLRALTGLGGLSDAVVTRELRRAALNPDAPAPSVEALLHAIIPRRYVDHTHSEQALALTNTPSGERHVRAAYGSSVIVVPYVRPGHALARLCAELIAEQLTNETIGLVLMNHGLVSFGDSARGSYEAMLELAARAEAYGAANGIGDGGAARAGAAEKLPAFAESVGLKVARLRAQISMAAGFPVVLQCDQDPLVLGFANRDDVDVLTQSGPATPDHVVYTKRVPMLGRDVDAYVDAYRRYFQEQVQARGAGSSISMLDPAPRVVLDPELGLCTAGRTIAEAKIAADLYRHTIEVILDASALESYQALPAQEIFEVEYWAAEQAKIKSGQHDEFAGQPVLVTGAASGIGAACVHEYLDRGACVVGLDISEAVIEVADGPGYIGIICDVTEPEQLAAAVERCVLAFGGIDMLVLSAGIFPASRRIEDLDLSDWRRTFTVNADSDLSLMRIAFPYLAMAPNGGRVVVIASKNVPAPGPGAASYSASKAALTQLARVAALEWGEAGVRVNILHPNAVFDTGIWTHDVVNARAASYGLTATEYRTNNVLRVEVRSRDVAALACAMCGPLFAKTTGAQVPIDGGNERVI
jgi:rhamnose utilization protein RhaD (predicted bifunctional aldolase and dehydrogenase)/NAD(P)-dependent dehydrogenase (short-subunit alcohol dehydrogenase family)